MEDGRRFASLKIDSKSQINRRW